MIYKSTRFAANGIISFFFFFFFMAEYNTLLYIVTTCSLSIQIHSVDI